MLTYTSRDIQRNRQNKNLNQRTRLPTGEDTPHTRGESGHANRTAALISVETGKLPSEPLDEPPDEAPFGLNEPQSPPPIETTRASGKIARRDTIASGELPDVHATKTL